MTRLQRTYNTIAVFVPAIGLAVAVVLLWQRAVDLFDLALLVSTYLLTAFGVTIGYHRMLTHRAFQGRRWVELGFATLGSMALQGPVSEWVADHRKHHAHTDRDGDPHSPHTGGGSGLRGLWHAHTGWLFSNQGQADKQRYAPDILEDPGLRRLDRSFALLTVVSLGLPALAGWAHHGGAEGALRGLVWGGLVRAFLLHHVTWSINSICHFYGARRFVTEDHSTNVGWLAVPSLGESWHHNHHAFPRSARHGLRRREIDVSGLVIAGLERAGLVSNVVRIGEQRQAERRATY